MIRGTCGSLSLAVGLPNNSYKPITNTARVCARLCKLQNECTRIVAASDKVYQFLAYGRWFSPCTPASSITTTARHDIAEILLKVALITKNQSIVNENGIASMTNWISCHLCFRYSVLVNQIMLSTIKQRERWLHLFLWWTCGWAASLLRLLTWQIPNSSIKQFWTKDSTIQTIHIYSPDFLTKVQPRLSTPQILSQMYSLDYLLHKCYHKCTG